jgi:hypothetical protein
MINYQHLKQLWWISATSEFGKMIDLSKIHPDLCVGRQLKYQCPHIEMRHIRTCDKLSPCIHVQTWPETTLDFKCPNCEEKEEALDHGAEVSRNFQMLNNDVLSNLEDIKNSIKVIENDIKELKARITENAQGGAVNQISVSSYELVPFQC